MKKYSDLEESIDSVLQKRICAIQMHNAVYLLRMKMFIKKNPLENNFIQSLSPSS